MEQNGYIIQQIPIQKVKLNPDNPRFIKDDAYRRLVKSLQDCPDLFKARPIICSDRTGGLVAIAGNMRLRAAKELKYKTVPVIVMQGLTVEQEREISIKDNGDAFGEFDFEILANDWSNLPLIEWGVSLPGDWLGNQNEGGGQEQGGEKKPTVCPECGHEWVK